MIESDPIITADDLVRTGACRDGVMSVADRLSARGRRIPAAMPVSAIMRHLTPDERKYVLRAAELDGFGFGYGSNYGDGDCRGDGDSDLYGDRDNINSGIARPGDLSSNVDAFGSGIGAYGNAYCNSINGSYSDSECDGNGDGEGYGYGYGRTDGYNRFLV